MSKFDKYVKTIPPLYKPTINPIVKALLKAWASGDDEIVQQLINTKDQLFVKTAEGDFLDKLGANVDVSRPSELGMQDEDFQNLIPILSFEPKQIRKTMYNFLDVFWGPLFSRANVQTDNNATFDLSTGDTITVKIDNLDEQEVKIKSGEIAIAGAATAEEVASILSRLKNATISVITDQVTGDEQINIRTNTPGIKGSVQVTGGSGVGGTKLDFTSRKIHITDFSQRTVIYEITHRELIIEIPAIVPALKRTLFGSHHFHEDATLESPQPPNNGTHFGSFLFDKETPFTLTGKIAELQSAVTRGNIFTEITVDDSSPIDNEPGLLIFDFGNKQQEQPVSYLSVPNDNTILIDPGHIFDKDHSIGSKVNVISSQNALVPRTNGQDYAIYLPSPSNSRQIIQELLKKLIAAGIVVNFNVLLPDYKYSCENVYA